MFFVAATTWSLLSLGGCASDDGNSNTNPGDLDAGNTSHDGHGGTNDAARTDVGAGSDAPVPEGGGAGGCKFDYTNYQAQTAPLTLKNDVLPILARGCALSTSCHRTGSTFPPVLGPGFVDGGVVATDMVLAGIMNALTAPATEVPDWVRLKKGDPEHSYLMRKLDGSQRCGDLTCVAAPGAPGSTKLCGERMPGGDSAEPLEPEEIKLIRDWIKQGAN
jgi:hypothetical protein